MLVLHSAMPGLEPYCDSNVSWGINRQFDVARRGESQEVNRMVTRKVISEFAYGPEDPNDTSSSVLS